MRVIGVSPSQDEKGRLFINGDYMAAVRRAGPCPCCCR